MKKTLLIFLLIVSNSFAAYNRHDKMYKLEYKGDSKKIYPQKKPETDETGKEYNDIPYPKKSKGYYKVGKPYTIMGQTYYPEVNETYKEVGMASWYGDGDGFHGEKTANGETYNMDDLTAAHRTLPLPSVVRITNLENGKNVVVRVNDRGPFVKNRIIDVSRQVAKILEFHGKGTTKVKVEYLKKETDKLLKELGFK